MSRNWSGFLCAEIFALGFCSAKAQTSSTEAGVTAIRYVTVQVACLKTALALGAVYFAFPLCAGACTSGADGAGAGAC